MLWITSLSASVLAFFYFFLSVRTLRLRRHHRVAIGDGHPVVQRAMRAHANFAEYVPLTLLLMALFEMSKGLSWLLMLGGALLVIGRLVHAHGISREPEDFRFRVLGMSLTFTAMCGFALANLYQILSSALLSAKG